MSKFQFEYLVQGSSDWINFRKDKIGSSDAAIIMGVSPFKTRIQLWEEKKGIRNGFENAAMRRGKELEQEAISKYEEMSGECVFKTVVSHEKFSWKIASLDGISFDLKKAVEVKCPSLNTHLLSLNEIVPDYYYPQLQHIMDVCQLEEIDYFSYFPGYDSKIIKVDRDDEYIKKMHLAEAEFFEYLQTDTPPPAFLSFEKTTNEEFLELEKLWKKEKLLLREHTDNLKTIEKKLEELYTETQLVGNLLKVSKVSRKGSVNYPKMMTDYQIDSSTIEKYRSDDVSYFKFISLEL